MPQSTQFHPGKTALLVIDVQRALFTRPNPIYKAKQLIETINILVDRSHLFGVKVIYVQHANQSFLKEGTEGWQFHPGLSRGEVDSLIQKKQGNAFLDTPLQSELEVQGIQNLLITGLVTQGCIRATCLGGLELGYRVSLVEDVHSNYNQEATAVIEKWQKELELAGVEIISTDRIEFV
ncbi:MAG: isochorismatase family protein [Anaerolineales bacterium]|nr:isochorismatase family protein [Anaerolineales bacterium]